MEEVERQGAAQPIPQYSADLREFQVDVRCFGLFLALQLFSQNAKYSENRTHLSQDAWGIRDNQNSPMLSPRTKATKINYTASEGQIIQHFVKSNLKLFLRLVASDINKQENA